MSYGMRIWGADGALQLDENSFTFRVALSVVVNNSGWTITNSAKGFGYQDFPVSGLTPSNGTATVIPIGNYTDSETQFETEVLIGVVRIYNYNRGFDFSGANASTASSMRLLVMRFS